MSAPTKPWEGGMQNNNSPSFIHGEEMVPGGGPTSVYRMPTRAVPANSLPPLPPRPARAAYPRMSPYAMSPYGSYGSYGMGSFGMGYPYGMRGQEFENRYVQLAEESAAPAFESIESFVRGFSAITMMLESTYQAVHMSFRAVLSIAENMSKMRAAVFDFLSALSIFKTIYHFYRKVLQFLGLVNGAEVSWKEAERLTQGALAEAGQSAPAHKSVWPMLAFFSAIVAGPTLVYKYLLPNGVPEEEEITLIAMYDFEADNSGELSFSKGEYLFVKKSQFKRGWMQARKGNLKGLIPSTRVAVLRQSSNKPNPLSQPPTSQPILAQPAPSQPILAQPAPSEPRNAEPSINASQWPTNTSQTNTSQTNNLTLNDQLMAYINNLQPPDESSLKLTKNTPEDIVNEISNPPITKNTQNTEKIDELEKK